MEREPCPRKRCPGQLDLWAWTGDTEFHVCDRNPSHIVERDPADRPVDERQDALPGLEQGAENP